VVLRAVNQLTEEQRTVVLYKCVFDYTTEEVAHLLNKRPGTIRALQFRGLNSLARQLGIASYALSGSGAHSSSSDRRERRQRDAARGR
jgi:DNA-directed RNA polymerase specialized sigma24 family protein